MTHRRLRRQNPALRAELLGRFSVRPGENDDHDGGHLLVAFTDMVLRSAENGSVALLDGREDDRGKTAPR